MTRLIAALFRNMSIRRKLLMMFLGTAAIMLIPMVYIGLATTEDIDTQAQNEINHLLDNDLQHVSDNIYSLILTHEAAVQAKVNTDLEVAKFILSEHGGAQTCDSGVQAWNAVNQDTRETVTVELDALCAGETWLGRTLNFDVAVPVVDEVQDLVGGTATIFQRMNIQGDMLRVATNVPTLDGQRAISTYVSAVNSDGLPNDVISTVIAGETYRGLAYVWNDWYLTAYEPLFDEAGEVIGMLYVGERLEEFGELFATLRDITIGESGYVFILDASISSRGEYILSKGGLRDGENVLNIQDTDGRYVAREMIDGALALEPGEMFNMEYNWQNPGDPEPQRVVSRVVYHAPWNWVIGFHANQGDYQPVFDRMEDERRDAATYTTGAGLLIAGIAAGGLWMASGVVSNPLQTMAGAAERMATGDLAQRVTVENKDETGVLANSFNLMAGNIEAMMAAEQAHSAMLTETVARYVRFVDHVASGDLTVRLDVGSIEHDDLVRLGDNLNMMVERLAAITDQVRESATNVLSASSEIQAAATEQSAISTQQDASVLQNMTIVEQINTAVKESSTRVDSVAQAAQRAVNVGELGKHAVEETVTGIDRILVQVENLSATIELLTERTQRIGEILATVNEIAEQSKFVALNASIEAARAGEQGKGFTVVSMEVRELASQSQQATTHITEILAEIEQASNAAVRAVAEGRNSASTGASLASEAGVAIDKLTTTIDDTALEAVAIAATIRQLATTSDQLNSAMLSIKQASAEAAAAASQTSQSAHDLSDMAYTMQSAISRYST